MINVFFEEKCSNCVHGGKMSEGKMFELLSTQLESWGNDSLFVFVHLLNLPHLMENQHNTVLMQLNTAQTLISY